MQIQQLLEQQYKEYLEVRSWRLNEQDKTTESDKRLAFLVDHVLDLTTYCEEYSVLLGSKILDVLKYCTRYRQNLVSTYDYSTTDTLGFTYCLIYQFISEWLDYGTSIYSAWLDTVRLCTGYEEISKTECKAIYTEFTSDADIIYFINFIDNKV
jgi:hypothetical protein